MRGLLFAGFRSSLLPCISLDTRAIACAERAWSCWGRRSPRGDRGRPAVSAERWLAGPSAALLSYVQHFGAGVVTTDAVLGPASHRCPAFATVVPLLLGAGGASCLRYASGGTPGRQLSLSGSSSSSVSPYWLAEREARGRLRPRQPASPESDAESKATPRRLLQLAQSPGSRPPSRCSRVSSSSSSPSGSWSTWSVVWSISNSS